MAFGTYASPNQTRQVVRGLEHYRVGADRYLKVQYKTKHPDPTATENPYSKNAFQRERSHTNRSRYANCSCCGKAGQQDRRGVCKGGSGPKRRMSRREEERRRSQADGAFPPMWRCWRGTIWNGHEATGSRALWIATGSTVPGCHVVAPGSIRESRCQCVRPRPKSWPIRYHFCSSVSRWLQCFFMLQYRCHSDTTVSNQSRVSRTGISSLMWRNARFGVDDFQRLVSGGKVVTRLSSSDSRTFFHKCLLQIWVNYPWIQSLRVYASLNSSQWWLHRQTELDPLHGEVGEFGSETGFHHQVQQGVSCFGYRANSATWFTPFSSQVAISRFCASHEWWTPKHNSHSIKPRSRVKALVSITYLSTGLTEGLLRRSKTSNSNATWTAALNHPPEHSCHFYGHYCKPLGRSLVQCPSDLHRTLVMRTSAEARCLSS